MFANVSNHLLTYICLATNQNPSRYTMPVRVKLDPAEALAQLNRAKRVLNQNEIELAAMRAINRATTRGRLRASKAIVGLYNIKPTDLAKGLYTTRANRTTLTGAIIGEGKGLPVGYFDPKKTAEGISVEVYRGKRQTIRRTFFLPGMKRLVVARGAYGGGTGFQFRTKRVRKRGNDLPISAIKTTSVAQAFGNEVTQRTVTADLQPFYEKRMEHELRNILRKLEGG